MIEIIATLQGGSTRTSLDVQETPVEFSYAIEEANDITAHRSPHSLRFTMPRSKTNDQFFSHYFEVSFGSGTFSAQQKTSVEVYDSGVVILLGVLQLHTVDSDGFEVSVLGDTADFFEAIRELSFPEVFINSDGTMDTDLDHALSGANVVDSWDVTNDITSGAVGDGVVVYPLSDWGQSADGEGSGIGYYYFQGMAGGSTPYIEGMGNGGADALIMANLKPAIQIKWLFERIAKKAGKTISSTFFSTDAFSKAYMFLATETNRVISRAVYGASVGLTANFSLFPNSISQLIFTSETGTFYDPDGLFTNGTFVAPFAGVFMFEANVIVTSPTTGGTGAYAFTLFALSETESFSHEAIFTYGVESTLIGQFSFTLGEGEEVQFLAGASNSLNNVLIYATGTNGYSYIKTLDYTASAQFVDMSENFPDFSVGTWVKEITSRFNLVMFASKEDPTVLHIEPYNDFLDASTTQKDWSGKVDIDSIKIEPTTKFQKKKVLFSDGEGEDWRNRYWQNKFGWVKGRYSYENPNEFAVDEQTVGGEFQPLRLSFIPSTSQNGITHIPNVLIPRFYDLAEAGQGVKDSKTAKPVLAYYLGEKDIGNDSQFILETETVTTFPYFTEYLESPVDTDTLSLAWGYDYPDNIDNVLINNGTTSGITMEYAFRHYWARYMNDHYSEESRILTCKAYLTPKDVNELQWNDEVFIENSFWRVIKIDNFATGGGSPCNLQLIKIIASGSFNPIGSCSSIPSTFNTNGTVNFVDASTGASVSPTRECCVNAGYTWDETDAVCFYVTGGGGGEGGGDGGGDGGGGGGNGGNPSKDDYIFNTTLSNARGNILGPLPKSSALGFNKGGVTGSTQTFPMYLTTVDATATQAKTEGGATLLPLQMGTVTLVTVDAVSVETGGPSGELGRTQTMMYQASLANIDKDARSVGSTSLINSEADAGASRSIAIIHNQASSGSTATFEIECTGEAFKYISWIIEVRLVQISIARALKRSPAFWNYDCDKGCNVLYLNSDTNDYLSFNYKD